MDLNLLLEAGMDACGRVLKLLPKDGEDGIGDPVQFMLKVYKMHTLPSLDIIHGVLITKTFGTGTLTPVDLNEPGLFTTRIGTQLAAYTRIMNDDRYSTYRIPSEMTDGHEILTIKSCVPVTANGAGLGMYGHYFNERPWNSRFGRASAGDLYGATLAAQVDYADRLMLGSISRGFRFYFFPPNIIAIRNYMGALNATFVCKNDESGMSVDALAFEGVKRLFILDLKRSIWNRYGNFTEVDTPYGTLDLKISNWENAEQERNELFDKYESTAHFRRSSIRASG